MPLVNLIAVQRSQRRAAERKMRVALIALLAIAAVCLLTVGGALWQVDRQQARLADLRAKSQSMAPYKKMIADGQKELAALKPRLATLQTASRYTDQWVRVLNHLALSLPDGTWLTNIRVQQSKSDDQPPEVSFIGYALDQRLVGELMLALNQCDDLGAIKLKYTDEKESGVNKGVEFEVYGALASATPTSTKDEGDAGS